jgi:hypothetical protein
VTVARTRSVLYSLARFLGNFQAIKNRKIGNRLARRAAGRGLGRLFRVTTRGRTLVVVPDPVRRVVRGRQAFGH